MQLVPVCIQALKDVGISDTDMVSDRSLRIVNRIFRLADVSALYPIYNKFSATERAVRWYRRVYFAVNGPCSNYEYILGLEARISQIVNMAV